MNAIDAYETALRHFETFMSLCTCYVHPTTGNPSVRKRPGCSLHGCPNVPRTHEED